MGKKQCCYHSLTLAGLLFFLALNLVIVSATTPVCPPEHPPAKPPK
ncbi:hypothetical protein LINGRAHAP2_LOCUS26223, partial [Linum grandiflorum]